MKVYDDLVQRSPEWLQIRCGLLTSTDAADLMATLKGGGEPARRRDLRRTKACERITGRAQASEYVNDAMQRGIDLEPVAIVKAEDCLGRLIQPCGFVAHDTLLAGCSPDGVLAGFAGLIEVKCPKSSTHLSYWQGGVVPFEYRPQLIHQLFITGAPWVEFCSFDDRFPEPLQFFHARYSADAEELEAYELLLRLFDSEIQKDVDRILALMQVA